MASFRRAVGVAVVAGVLGMGSSAVVADFVPIMDSPGSELDHAEILEGVFSPGTAWTPFGPRTDTLDRGVDLTNGLLQAVRVDDFGLGGVLNANVATIGDTDDQRWTGGPVVASAKARYASYSQQLGYDLHGDKRGYKRLFKVNGSGLNVTGGGTLELSPGNTWDWVRSGNGGEWYSDPANNRDGLDHLVTYQLRGTNDDLNHWLLFWEDLNHLGDQDYNDLVVELSTPVPEPGTAVLAGVGFGVLLSLRRRLS